MNASDARSSGDRNSRLSFGPPPSNKSTFGFEAVFARRLAMTEPDVPAFTGHHQCLAGSRTGEKELTTDDNEVIGLGHNMIVTMYT
jgi:hypothetical protein